MGELDGWAVALGQTACRYLSRNNHDALYQTLCSDGSSSAGWKLLAFTLLFGLVSFALWRLFRPA